MFELITSVSTVIIPVIAILIWLLQNVKSERDSLQKNIRELEDSVSLFPTDIERDDYRRELGRLRRRNDELLSQLEDLMRQNEFLLQTTNDRAREYLLERVREGGGFYLPPQSDIDALSNQEELEGLRHQHLLRLAQQNSQANLMMVQLGAGNHTSNQNKKSKLKLEKTVQKHLKDPVTQEDLNIAVCHCGCISDKDSYEVHGCILCKENNSK